MEPYEKLQQAYALLKDVSAEKLQKAHALLKDVAAESLEYSEATLDEEFDLVTQHLEHAVIAVREAMNLLEIWPSENLDEVTTPERQYIDEIATCEVGWLASYIEMYDMAQISVRQQMYSYDTCGGMNEPTEPLEEAKLKHEWLFAVFEYSEAVYFRGERVLLIEHDTEKGGWGMTATFEDGTTERRSHYA